MSETKNTTSQYSIVRKIQTLLKLGETGKLDSFFSRVEKTLTRDIQAHEKNIESLKFNHSQKADELKDQLEDAEQALDDSYLNVTAEDVSTNEKQKDFMDEYLQNIGIKAKEVKRIKDKIKEEETTLKDKIDAINLEISSLKDMIANTASK